MIETVTFGLRLRPGCEAEYQRRHDEIWPELRAALLEVGILHYEIHLLRPEGLLFAFQHRRRDHQVDRLRETEVFRRWQAHMADILVQDGDGPLRLDLEPMFALTTPGLFARPQREGEG
jgi:L-rhamnose mutarotase